MNRNQAPHRALRLRARTRCLTMDAQPSETTPEPSLSERAWWQGQGRGPGQRQGQRHGQRQGQGPGREQGRGRRQGQGCTFGEGRGAGRNRLRGFGPTQAKGPGARRANSETLDCPRVPSWQQRQIAALRQQIQRLADRLDLLDPPSQAHP